MARFQISQATIEDRTIQGEVRKVSNELASKLNILAQSFTAYANTIAISFTTQSLTATLATITTLTATTATITTLTATSANITTLVATTVNGQVISGGSYNPASTSVANITTVTPSLLTWSRTGNTVVVGGAFVATVAASGVATSFRFNLPVASNFSATTQLGGVAYNAPNQASWAISSSIANDEAVFESFGICPTVSIQYQFSFTYLVQ